MIRIRSKIEWVLPLSMLHPSTILLTDKQTNQPTKTQTQNLISLAEETNYHHPPNHFTQTSVWHIATPPGLKKQQHCSEYDPGKAN